MNRRNFLFGTVAAAAAGTALVLQSQSNALKLFQPTLEETLAISRVPKPDINNLQDPYGIGEVLYNAQGFPVILVSSATIHAAIDKPIEVSLIGDVHKSFVTNVIKTKYQMEVIGHPLSFPRIR